MSNTHVFIVVEDFDVRQAFERLETAIAPYSLSMFLREDAASFFRTNIEERFNEEGDALSGFWPPLKPATVNIKEELGVDRPEAPNIRTGDMFDALTGEYDVTMGPGFAQLDIPGEVDGFTREKIQMAQQGKAENENPFFGPTPRRPVLATSEMQLATLLERLEMNIVERMVRGFTL